MLNCHGAFQIQYGVPFRISLAVYFLKDMDKAYLMSSKRAYSYLRYFRLGLL